MEKGGSEYDLIVIGAGPAGSACAITAARAGAKALLLEKDRFPRHKVCGEFVSSESLGLLTSLLANSPEKGMYDPLRGKSWNLAALAARLEIDSARIFLDNKVVRLPILPPAQSIPRFDLDAALFDSALRCGVDAREDVVVRRVEHTAVFTVDTEAERFSAKAVVNCTGRWSQLTQYEAAGQEKWIGLKAHFSETQPPNSVDLYYFHGGYCGVLAVAKDAVNACAMVRADAGRSLEEVFAAHPELWRRSRNWTQLFPTVTTSALYFRKPVTCDQGVILAGDAAGFIDPFAGDGISLALQSGALAAESLAGFLQGKATLDQAQQQYAATYSKRLAPAFRNSARLRKLLAAPLWLRSMLLGLVGTRPVGGMTVRGTRARTDH
jgi:menaquinone-9 beta-reductase